MKPIKLEMTAFGSYARLTTVDFQKMEHCLYLITGDTGAGKTTIFDGIMFALYGVASGKGDKKYRTFEMMHCDYVSKAEDTIVKLDFEHMGNVYTVERKFHFRKKRNTGEYEKTTPQAKFWEPDKDVLEQTDAVTARITELLGMSAEQFRKIAMLAQGEFKKFLDADSEEKNQILGELFDHSAYVCFQEIFDRARKRLARHREEKGNTKIRKAMDHFIMPEDISGEEQELYIAGHSRLEEALLKLTEKDRKEQEKLKQQSKACRDKENQLRETLGKAEEQNKKLEELEQKKKAFEEMQEKRPDIERLKEKVDRVEKAFHKVLPKHDRFIDAGKLYQNTIEKIEELSDQLSGLQNDKKAKKELLDACRQDNGPVIEQLGNEIAEIKDALPKYNDLENKILEWQKESTAEEQARKKRKKTEENKEKTEEKIKELKNRIRQLDGIEKTAQQLGTALNDTTKDLDKLTARGGIRDQVGEIHKKEVDLKRKQKVLEGLLEEVRNLESDYHSKYQAFIKGQAGLLARNLEQELQEKEEAVCPVCKTMFQSSAACCFAEFVEGTPEQRDVDTAKAAFEDKDKERQESSRKIAEQETTVKSLKESVISKLRELKPDCPDWDTLDDTSHLEETIKEYEDRKKQAKKEYDEAEKQRRTLEKLKKEQSEKEDNLQDYEDGLKDCMLDEQVHRDKRISLEATLAELKKNLKYQSREAAEIRKDELQKEKEERTNKIHNAEKIYNEAEQQFRDVSGNLKGQKDNLTNFKIERDKAEKDRLEEIKEQGFQDMEEVHRLLKQAGEKDAKVESWLKLKDGEIKDFEKELENTEKRIKELNEETKNLEKTDLAQLNESIKNWSEEYGRIQVKLDLCKEQYKNHRSTADAVREANQALKDTESTWKRLDSLADLATGINSEGGKLSFDRYVMGYVFREVLGMANQRLDIMSGGRYELIHERSANRNNAKAGLEITVLDMTTGKRRSVSSLSGGETFFVSLALALGLSDVVQNHAGGKRLDALFIDEGFGTLDNDVLEHALAVLNQLTEGQRLVGIISHVEKLKESIPQQIQVRNSERGSFLEIVI